MTDVTREEFNRVHDAVFGNGVIGHKQRIERLEAESDGETCPTAKAFKTYLSEMDKRKKFRTGDIANYIALAALAYLIFKDII